MKKTVLIVLTSISLLVSGAQKEASYKLIATIRGDLVDFAVDHLDNVYVLTSTDQLTKYNAYGDSVAMFNNVK